METFILSSQYSDLSPAFESITLGVQPPSVCWDRMPLCRTGSFAASSSPSPAPLLSLLGLWEHCLLFFCFLIYYLKILKYDASWAFSILLFLQFYCFFFTSSSQVLLSITAKRPSRISAFKPHCMLQQPVFCLGPHLLSTFLLSHPLGNFTFGPQIYAYLLWFLWNVNTSDPFFLSWMSLLPGSFPHLAYDSCVLSAGSSFSYMHCSEMISFVPSVYSLSSGNIQSWSTDTLFLWAPAPPFPKVPLDIARSIWKSNSYILLAFSTETNTSLCPKRFSISELEVSQDREEPDTPNLLITWVELLFLISILVQHKHLWKVTFSLRHLESSSFPICLLWGFKCSRLRYEVEERLGNTGPFLN